MSAPTAAALVPGDLDPASRIRSPRRSPMAVNALTPSRSISRSPTWSSIHARITGP